MNNLSFKHLKPTVDSIVSRQKADGSIPWLDGGITDPWTHVENAMAIDIGNYKAEAELAYEWLANTQMEDGSWYTSYQDGKPQDTSKISHNRRYILPQENVALCRCRYRFCSGYERTHRRDLLGTRQLRSYIPYCIDSRL